jgi:very-short-patch-repair endonuclease
MRSTSKSPPRNIVIGQKIDPAKAQRAKMLRRRMTKAERMLWHHLRANRLGGFQFRRQQVIDGFIVDFDCHAGGLVIEVDGTIHKEQVEYDVQRDCVLAARGLDVLRVKNHEIQNDLGAVLDRILAVIRRCLQEEG